MGRRERALQRFESPAHAQQLLAPFGAPFGPTGDHFRPGAVGFGLTTPAVLASLQREGALPMTPFGFRAMGGPFEALGREWVLALGWTLVATCVADAATGAAIWRGDDRAAHLARATAPVTLILAIGFALPFLLLVAPIRLVILLAARRRAV